MHRHAPFAISRFTGALLFGASMYFLFETSVLEALVYGVVFVAISDGLTFAWQLFAKRNARRP